MDNGIIVFDLVGGNFQTLLPICRQNKGGN